MSANPFLSKLGLQETDRVIILHADDIGMCHASVEAYQQLLAFGLMSSAATMVPCPWFPQTAAYLRDQQSAQPQIDMGVHLTLTAEWDVYRWGALTCDAGLVDDEGYFYRTTAAAQTHGSVEAVTAEIRAQVERAAAAGIDITHIDSHMGSIFSPAYLPAYFQLAAEFQIPPFIMRPSEAMLNSLDLPAAQILAMIKQVETAGLPVFDHVGMLPLNQSANRLDTAKAIVDTFSAGSLSILIFHPSIDTPELRAIAPDWQARVADYELFRNEAWRSYIVEECGFHLLGYRHLREAMRG